MTATQKTIGTGFTVMGATAIILTAKLASDEMKKSDEANGNKMSPIPVFLGLVGGITVLLIGISALTTKVPS